MSLNYDQSTAPPEECELADWVCATCLCEERLWTAATDSYGCRRCGAQMVRADADLYAALARSLALGRACIDRGASLTKQSRAAKKLRATNDRVLRELAARDRRRHGTRDDAAYIKALEAFHTVACEALGLPEEP